MLVVTRFIAFVLLLLFENLVSHSKWCEPANYSTDLQNTLAESRKERDRKPLGLAFPTHARTGSVRMISTILVRIPLAAFGRAVVRMLPFPAQGIESGSVL